MDIVITKSAQKWFKDELDLLEGQHVRIFSRYGGDSQFQSGFSIGIAKEEPKEIGAFVTYEGIIYYIEDDDLWFFGNNGLHIRYDQHKDEVQFEVLAHE